MRSGTGSSSLRGRRVLSTDPGGLARGLPAPGAPVEYIAPAACRSRPTRSSPPDATIRAGTPIGGSPLAASRRPGPIRSVLPADQLPPVVGPTLDIQVRPAARTAPLVRQQHIQWVGHVDPAPAGPARQRWHVRTLSHSGMAASGARERLRPGTPPAGNAAAVRPRAGRRPCITSRARPRAPRAPGRPGTRSPPGARRGGARRP